MSFAAAPACASPAIVAQYVTEYVTEYEVLRGAALGEALPLKARSGLALFLRRGMWGWARALMTATRCPQEQVAPPTAGWPASSGHNTIVHVPATIATSIGERRAP